MTVREQSHKEREEAAPPLPRVLVIDDLFGRVTSDASNPERRDLCGQFLLEDVTGDLIGAKGAQKIKRPVAQAVFCRGQTPANASTGNTVENDLEAALDLVRKHWQAGDETPPLAMVLLDLCFYTGSVTAASESKRGRGMPAGRDGDDQPDTYFGLRVLEALHDRFPDLPVVILSSMPRESVSQQFSRMGALGFLPRGDANSPNVLREYLLRHGLVPDATGTVIGRSKGVLLALRAARRAAASRKNVLLRGDTGTGKELLARYVHDQTPDIGGAPFVPVDSGALSPSLYASELFGHRRGAFTGAVNDREGRLAQADGGDLFLDEIGNMPEDVQVGILRAIEQKEVTPVGAKESRRVNVRFITATNVDIEGKAATGQGFRADLYYRLREGGVIYLPPLRERREDIPLLVERFVREAEAANPKAMRRSVEEDALALLARHDWPGNVRELRDAIYKAVNDHPDVEHLVPGHLPLAESGRGGAPAVGKGKPHADGPVPITPPTGAIGLSDVMAIMNRTVVDPSSTPAWAGRWSELQRAYAGVAMQLLRAALLATRRVTPDNPEGEIKIHPAIKILTGDASIAATKAADVVKRIFSGLPDSVRTESLKDPILKAAHDTAVRLRPRSSVGRGAAKT